MQTQAWRFAAEQVSPLSVTADVSLKEKEKTASQLMGYVARPRSTSKTFNGKASASKVPRRRKTSSCVVGSTAWSAWGDPAEAVGLLNDPSLGFKERLWTEMHDEPFKGAVKTITFDIPGPLRAFIHQIFRVFFLVQRSYQRLNRVD